MIGQTISHYRILEKLGEGGMGVVYKAEDTRLKRTVALKFLPPDLTRDHEAIERFVREAQAASALQHPNICTIHDIDEAPDGHLFMVMDCYEGETLKKKIEKEQLSVESVINIAIQIAEGLLDAHQHGIIHRDIKPTNILITENGVVKILDFGLAKLAGQVGTTQVGATVGTVAYMSPEQIRGEQLDRRTDIWSFGVVLYEMLTKHRPFRGEHTAALMYSITNEDPADIVQYRKDVPESLQQLCEQCLEKDASDRPESMEEVLQLLSQYRLAKPASMRRIGHRSRRLVIGALSLFALGLIGWFALFQPWRRSAVQEKVPLVGIQPFRNLTNESRTAEWPLLIQAMMFDNLAGNQEFAVVDPQTLNNFMSSSLRDVPTSTDLQIYQIAQHEQISILVEGSIRTSTTGYEIQWMMKDPATGVIKHSNASALKDENDLHAVAREISNQILVYFEIKLQELEQDEDYKPWLRFRTKNLLAVKAFYEASQLKWNMQAGGDELLRRAIRLDSTFIAPRIFLLVSLADKRQRVEAEENYKFLLSLESQASPLEQALIHWCGACIRGDLSGQERSLEQALMYSAGRNNALLYFLGESRYAMKNYQGAADAYLKTVEMKWPFQPAHYMLASSYVHLREFDKAAEVLSNSLAYQPVYPATYSLLSSLEFLRKDTNAARMHAEVYVREARKSGESSGTIFATLGRDCSSTDAYTNAISYYTKAIAYEPKTSQHHLEYASALYHLGSIDSAQSEFQETLRLDSALFEAHRMLAKISDRKNDSLTALGHYCAYLRYDSTSVEAKEIQVRVDEIRGINNNRTH